jgi:uncharacterized membrane protein YccC
VDHDELLRRLDGHTERGNTIMARSNELMLRNEIAFRDLRDFLAEQTMALRALTAEFKAEMGAQREALFRILDRLDGNGAAGA